MNIEYKNTFSREPSQNKRYSPIVFIVFQHEIIKSMLNTILKTIYLHFEYFQWNWMLLNKNEMIFLLQSSELKCALKLSCSDLTYNNQTIVTYCEFLCISGRTTALLPYRRRRILPSWRHAKHSLYACCYG